MTSAMTAALLGGAMIGLAASLLLVATGHVAGVSGIVGGLLRPRRGDWTWRVAFLVGLLSGGLVLAVFKPTAFGETPRGLPILAVAGLLVGYGTRLGGGCTSGHGVCGVSRLSLRSIAATVTFVAGGIATVAALRALGVG